MRDRLSEGQLNVPRKTIEIWAMGRARSKDLSGDGLGALEELQGAQRGFCGVTKAGSIRKEQRYSQRTSWK